MSGCGAVQFGQGLWPLQKGANASQTGATNPAESGASAQQPGNKQGPDKQIGMDELMAAAEIQAAQVKAMLFGRDSDVRSHEAAHQAAAGHLAGGINLDMATKSIPKPDGTTETVTYAAGGSVPIRMPGVPKAPPKTPEGRAQLEQVKADLQLAQAGAEAPGGNEMSGADAAIAGSAQSGQAAVDALLSQGDNQPPERKAAAPGSPDQSSGKAPPLSKRV